MIRDMQSKRLLVVDDEPAVAMVLAENLEKVDDEYVVETAHSGDEALTKIEEGAYALVITDYKMPGMSGLDLVRAVHDVSPGTQVVLMTAYGSSDLRDTVDHLGLSGYLDKPFTMEQIRGIVKRAIGRTAEAEGDPYRSGELSLEYPVNEQLEQLRLDTQARCVMLLSSSGYPVEVAGRTDDLSVANVSALVAANFMAAAELARLLGTGSVFKSSYHEGTDYNIYSYDLGSDLLLAVITDSDCKAGTVWFYTKQTVSNLEPVLEQELAAPDGDRGLNGADLTEGLDKALDDLFNESGDESNSDKLMNLDEALEAGLVPSEWGESTD
jgi:two-component system, response regulator, stage 0 sporulation protein F